MKNKYLFVIFFIFTVIIAAEVTYLIIMLRTKNNSPVNFQKKAPVLKLDYSEQDFRRPETPNRVQKFLTNAITHYLESLNNNSAVKQIEVQLNSYHEGVADVLQGEEVRKAYPPNPKFPERRVVVAINLENHDGDDKTKDFDTILLVPSEMPNLTVTDKKGKKISLKNIIGKKVSVARIISLTVGKGEDIVTKEPNVYTNVVLLE